MKNLRIFPLLMLLVVVCDVSSCLTLSETINGAQDLFLPRMKRSLCNTFGGCGSKRSLMDNYEISDDISYENDRDLRIESEKAKLVAEILEGLIDHLRHDQQYKQGKNTARLPKQQISTNYHQPGSPNGERSPLDVQVITPYGGRNY